MWLCELVCCAFSFCWWACGVEGLELVGAPPRSVLEEEEKVVPAASVRTEEGGKRSEQRRRLRAPLPPWPRALRRVRGWLEPYIMVWRYWRAFTEKDPPEEGQVLKFL
jgi:hypothetical protein